VFGRDDVVCAWTGGVFSKTEMSEVLTEIVRMDPTFDKEEFIKMCRFDMIPNILEVLYAECVAPFTDSFILCFSG